MSELESTRASEIYKPIEGYPGYRVGNFGDVQSAWNRGKHSRITGEWWSMKQAKAKGYWFVGLSRNKERHKYFYIHRLVLGAFVGKCPDGMECRHLDRNPDNNHLENLEWGTKEQNELDKIGHGTRLRGKQIWIARLTECDVAEIRRLWAAGCSQRKIAKTFGTKQANVSCIVLRKTWKHVA